MNLSKQLKKISNATRNDLSVAKIWFEEIKKALLDAAQNGKTSLIVELEGGIRMNNLEQVIKLLKDEELEVEVFLGAIVIKW